MGKIVLTTILLTLSLYLHSAEVTPEFSDPVQETRYQALLNELRCVVCQNQSLADSHAELAQDLRGQVYTLMSQGQNDAQIKEFLVARYGDFILYNPPLKSTTWLLWLSPLLLFCIALATLFYFIRRRNHMTSTALTEAERHKIEQVLND